MNINRGQRGIALITAILVVALASIAAAAVLGSTMIAIHRAENTQDSEKAWWYADGVESWIKTILQRDAQDNQTDSLLDDWAKPVDYLPVDQGFIRGRIIDLQGRFNLNNLGGSNWLIYAEQFERLLQNIDGADPFKARPLAAAIHDWIDADQEPTGGDGAEDSEYLTVSPPYRTPNRNMESVSELLAIKGMDKKLYLLLRDYVTVLPEQSSKININTAPEAVLRSLVKQPTPDLERFLREREKKPAEQGNVFPTVPGLEPVVKSSFFASKVEAFIGTGRVALYSFYKRPDQGAPIVRGRSTDDP